MINMISGGPIDGDFNQMRTSISQRMENCVIEKRIWTESIISFRPEDMCGVSDPHNDAPVIQEMISNYEVTQIFVDSGSSSNMSFKEAIDQMDLYEYKMEIVIIALFKFTGHTISPLEIINFLLYLGKGDTKL